MLDALVPAIEVLEEKPFANTAKAAREGAQSTAAMSKASAGRSAYLRAETLDGVVDPGAEAIARIFESLVYLDVAE